MQLPTDISYGYVVWRALLAVADSILDADQLPDALAADGKVRFTPVSTSLVSTASGNATIIPQVIECTIDSAGFLTDPAGSSGVFLITGQYDVAFISTRVAQDKYRIDVKATHTTDAPLDLALKSPIPPAPSTVFVVNQQVYNDALAARDAAIAAAGNAAESASSIANLSNTFQPLGTTELGSRFLFLGDSITAGSVTADQTTWGGGFAQQAAMQSGGQIVMTRNAGVSGNKSADMLARFATDVTPFASQIDAVFLLAGTNDSAVTAFSTWISTMKSLVTSIRSLGKAPVMATIPPNNATAPRPAAITQQNAWIRRYAQQQRIPLVDFYKVLVDPTTGHYVAAYTADGTHPTPAGEVVMATALLQTLSPLLAPSSVPLPQDNSDPNNLLTNGCLVNWGTPLAPLTITGGTVASGGALAAGTYYYRVTVLNYQGESLPSNELSVTIAAGQEPQLTISNAGGQRVLNIYRGTAPGNEVLLAANVAPAAYPASTVWTDTGALAPGAQTPPSQDYTAAPTGWGSWTGAPAKLAKLTDGTYMGTGARYASSGSLVGQQQTISSGFAVGDTLAFLVRAASSGGGIAPSVSFQFFNGAAGLVKYSFTGTGTAAWGGLYYIEVVAPTGANKITATIQCPSTGAGTVDYGQIGVYNLTALGVL